MRRSANHLLAQHPGPQTPQAAGLSSLVCMGNASMCWPVQQPLCPLSSGKWRHQVMQKDRLHLQLQQQTGPIYIHQAMQVKRRCRENADEEEVRRRTSTCTERSVWVSVSVRVLETRVHSASGPKPPSAAAALGGRHTRSSCNSNLNHYHHHSRPSRTQLVLQLSHTQSALVPKGWHGVIAK